MTIKEFDNIGWTPNMVCEYCEEEREIISVDFEEKLVFMANDGGGQMVARCENVSKVRRKI